MELRQNMHRTTTRPIAWVAAILVTVALALMAWYALPTSTSIHPASVRKAPATGAAPLLDRAAERQPASRDGGPGGQIGDIP